MIVSNEPIAMIFIDRSRCVRGASSASLLPLKILPTKVKALLITPQLFITPMMPAIAMPPMPMLLA